MTKIDEKKSQNVKEDASLDTTRYLFKDIRTELLNYQKMDQPATKAKSSLTLIATASEMRWTPRGGADSAPPCLSVNLHCYINKNTNNTIICL